MSSSYNPPAPPIASERGVSTGSGIHAPPSTAAQSTMVILPLGGGQEVGRSCILLQYNGRNILLDCGIHPGREGMDACPFFDIIEPSQIDMILVTHFHLDHCACLPYFTEKTDFKGRVFMTHATKAVMRLLISDYIKLQFSGGRHNSNALFNDEDLLNCINKCETINFHQTVDYKGVKFTPSCAGHVLGAAIYTIDIDGVVVVYTGDYSMEDDRHLAAAEIPVLERNPDVLIVESTYGNQIHPSREEREFRFTKTAEDIVNRGGHALLPVFALGRAQELLLLLEEHWKKNIHLQHFPIYYASKVASKALRLYQTFINSMNANVQRQLDVGNPFKFKYIENINRFDASNLEPCVVVAAPGMLQNGVSRQLFELWCEDSKNGVLLAGYSVEGTLAKRLLSQPKEIACLDGRIKQRKCSIEYVSFSAHVDYVQNWSFIRSVVPDNIILVHGEKGEMGRLKVELDREIKRGNWPDSTHKPPVLMPENGQSVKVAFKKSVVGYAVGEAAKEIVALLDNPEVDDGEGQSVLRASSSLKVLVAENFVFKVVSLSELELYTSLRRGHMLQRQHVSIPPATLQLFSEGHNRGLPLVVVYPSLQQIFEGLEFTEDGTDKYPVIYHYAKVSETSLHLDRAAGESLTKISGSVDIGSGSVLSQACSDKDFMTVGNALKICYYIGEDDSKSIVVEWSADPMYDWMAESAICSIFYFLSIENALRLSTGPDKPSISDVESAEDGVISRMRKGLIDPSRHSSEIDSNLRDSHRYNILMRIKENLAEKFGNAVGDMDVDFPCDEDDLDTSRCRSWFAFIKLDKSGKRLIISSNHIYCEDGSPAIAYVFMHFKEPPKGCAHGTESVDDRKHHAVVQCTDDFFRKQVKFAISCLSKE